MQCRVCLKTNCNTLINMAVADTDEGHTLFDFFNDCTQLHASVNDNFPKTLCKTCTSNLRIAYSFRKCALESNDVFEKVLTLQMANTQSTVNSMMDNDDYTEDPLKIEYEYGYDPEIINETIVVEQSPTSCHSNENSFIGIEKSEIDTVEYVEGDSQNHIKRKYEEILHDDQIQIKNIIRNNLNNDIEKTDRIDIEIATNKSRCLYCTEIYSSDFELQDHVKSHLFKCLFCSKICTDVGRYYRHIKRLHDLSEIDVPASQAVIKGVEINEDKRIYCKTCKVAYSNIFAYGRHFSRKHYSENIDADMSCGDIQIVENKVCCTQKDVHENISYVEKDVEHDHCRESESNMIENTTDENKFTINIQECTQSDRFTQISEDNLREQIDRCNLKEKEKFLCSFCPRVLLSKRAVEIHEGKQHLNIESDMKKCSFCQKNFDKTYLRKHIEIVHFGVRKYKCDICGNMYKTNDNAMRHRLLHTKDRYFPCTVCDKRFADKSELKVHMRLHTGEQPFACHLCDRNFRIRVHLTYHLQQHALIKHKCTVCGKEFKHGKSLRNHFYIHTNVMQYRCSICGYGSVKREYFVKHMLDKHDKTMSVDELLEIFQANTGRSPYVKVVDDIDMNDELTQDMETAN